MFYLIGVEHKVQHIGNDGAETADHTEFRVCLEQAISSCRPVVVGEEFSNDSLARANLLSRGVPQEFFTRQIAAKAGVKHMLCDPEIKIRIQIGYRNKEDWMRLIEGLWDRVPDSEIALLGRALEISKSIPLREEYWLNELKAILEKNLIFVCGDSHVESFGDRLSARKIPSKAVKRKIGMTPELIKESDSEFDYLKRSSVRVEKIFQKILEENGGSLPPVAYARYYK